MPGAPTARRRLQLALVCPYSLTRPGGVQAQVLGLARAYRDRGHEVAVLAPVDDGTSGPVPPGIDLVPTGRSLPVPANGSVAPVVLSPPAVRRAVRALRALSPDAVHVHEPFAPGLPIALLLVGAVPPEVATFHRSGAGTVYRSLAPAFRRLGRRLAARCAVSAAARDTATAVVDGPVDVLFNGVECERFARAEPWPSARPAVLFLGRHEERKGLAVLLEAFGRLRRRDGRPDCELWVAGEGPATAGCRRRWPPDERLHWLGVLSEEEKARRLAAAAVLCAPSLGRESFGVVLLEAMAAGAVVVASDIPGYRDAAGGRAVLVPPGGVDDLAEALAGVLEGRLAVSEGMGAGPAKPAGAGGRSQWLEEARAVADSFSMARLAERYEAVVARVLEGAAGDRS